MLNVTPILKESRIFNMCAIFSTGYINIAMQKKNIEEIQSTKLFQVTCLSISNT